MTATHTARASDEDLTADCNDACCRGVMNDKHSALSPEAAGLEHQRSTGPHRVYLERWISLAPFERFLNMNIHEAADGKAVLSMPFLFDLAQGGGLMHGGALVSLADTALVMAIKSLVPPDTPFVTASFEARYLRPFDRGTATAKAHVHHHEGRSFLGLAIVFDEDGRPVMEFSSQFKIQRPREIAPLFISEVSPGEIRRRMAQGETFVLNIIASWCPDCTERQAPRLPHFIERLKKAGIPFHQITVQHEKMRFISAEHEKITEEFGGQGYPRTVLIVDGAARSRDNVEIVTRDALERLAEDFIAQVEASRSGHE